MPIQIIAKNGENAVQVTLNGHQQTQIQLGILNDVDAVSALGTAQAVGSRLLHFTGSNRHDVGMVFRKQRTEYFVKQNNDGIAHPVSQALTGQIDPQNLLTAVNALGHTVDGHLLTGSKIVVLFHAPVSRGLHADVGSLTGDRQTGNIHLVAHNGRIRHVGQMVMAHLTVRGTAGNMVGRTAHQDLTAAGHAEHFVILAAKGKELTRQVFLEHMAAQLGTKVLLFALLVLGDITRILQIAQQKVDKFGIRNVIHAFHGSGVHGETALHAQNRRPEHGFDPVTHDGQQFVAVLVKGDRPQAAAAVTDFVPEILLQITDGKIGQDQLTADLCFTDHSGAHPQANTQHHIAHRGCVIGHNIGNGLGVGIEQVPVVRHVILEQILGGNDVNEALLCCTGGKFPLEFKHIAGFIFHGQVLVLLNFCIPWVVRNLEVFLHGFLRGRQVGIVQQIVVILPRDPMNIPHRECLAAIPPRFGNLILQCCKGQLGTHAEIAGQIGQQSVLQVLAAGLPAHIGGYTGMVVGGRNLGQAGQQNVRQRIHQTVTVFVRRAVNDLLAAAAAPAHQRIQADLGGRYQAGRLDDHDKFHFTEKFVVGFMQCQIVNTGTGHNAHVQFLLPAVQHTDVPQSRHSGHSGQTIPTPRFHIPFNVMTSQNDQYAFAAQQRTVHGIGHIGDQIVVEGIVEQDAAAAEQSAAGIQIVVVQFQPLVHLAAHKAAVGFQLDIITLFQLQEQFIVGSGMKISVIHGGAVGAETVSEQLGQHIAQQCIVGHTVGFFRFAGQ